MHRMPNINFGFALAFNAEWPERITYIATLPPESMARMLRVSCARLYFVYGHIFCVYVCVGLAALLAQLVSFGTRLAGVYTLSPENHIN